MDPNLNQYVNRKRDQERREYIEEGRAKIRKMSKALHFFVFILFFCPFFARPGNIARYGPGYTGLPGSRCGVFANKADYD